MKSRFASVNEQSGISAGSGGYDITVGNNTDLKGAVIASTATDTANNNLDTGTISFSEVKNSGYYDVDSMSISASVSTNSLTPTAPSAYHNGDKQNSTTQSAIANGNLTVRNKDAQKQDVDTLSHDTENANTKLKAFFDKDKEQDRMDTVQMVKDVTVQVKTVGTKIDRLNAQKEVDKNGISKTAYDAAKDTLGTNATEKQVKALAYSNAVDKAVIDATKDGNNIAGIGSGFNKAVDAGASLVTGAITGDVLGGIAGASAPYLATAIKNATGHQNPESGKWEMDDDDKAANYVFHGMLGAGVAALQGNSVLACAVGAAGGEFAANTIRDNFYDGKDTKDLTESEKQNISNWSQIASGAAAFAGSGGNMGAAGTAMSASKNAVENNLLSNKYGVAKLDEKGQTIHKKLNDAGIGDIDELVAKYASCDGNSDCQKNTRDEYNYIVTEYASAMVTGAGEGQEASDIGFSLANDVYGLSGAKWTPAGMVNDPYVSTIRESERVADLKANGASDTDIQEALQRDNVIAAYVPVDSSYISNLLDDGIDPIDVMMAATSVSKGKVDSAFFKNPKQIKDVKAISANDANASFIKNGWNAPYDSSTQVRQFTTANEVEFVRVHSADNRGGRFMVRADEIKGMTPKQIQQHLALPSVPTHISDVKVPVGTKMQVGTVAPQPLFGAPNKGGTQYQLLQQIPKSSFYNTRPL